MTDLIWEHSIGNTAKGPAPEIGESFEWQSVEIGFETVKPLNGFTVSMRPKFEIASVTPPIPVIERAAGETPTPTYTWPDWEITSQEITISKPKAGPKVYASAPKGYQGGFLNAPGVYSDPAGIVNGTGYQYLEVFDDSEFSFLEAHSGQTREEFRGGISISTTGGNFPRTPYNPNANPPVYPMDTVTSFSPDERESVTIRYTIKTKYKTSPTLGPQGILGQSGEHIIQINHVVTQPHHNSNFWSEGLKAVLQRCYFTHHIYH